MSGANVPTLHGQREGYLGRPVQTPHQPGRALADPPRQGRQDRARHPAPRRTPAPHRPGLRTQQHHRAHPRPRPTHHRDQRRHRRDHPRPHTRPHPRLPTPWPTTRTTQRQPPTRRTQEEEHPTDINEVARHLLTMSRDFTMEPPRGFEPRTCSLRVSCSTPELRRRASLGRSALPDPDGRRNRTEAPRRGPNARTRRGRAVRLPTSIP